MFKKLELIGNYVPGEGFVWKKIEDGPKTAEPANRFRVKTDDEVGKAIRRMIEEKWDAADEVGEDLPETPAGGDFPKIKRVVFNDPVTKVWFEDGTTSLVKASKDDVFSKEAGLAFAIVKRLYGIPDDLGNYGSGGYMMELKRVIGKAYDQSPLTAKLHAEKEARRKAREAEARKKEISKGKPAGKPKGKRS